MCLGPCYCTGDDLLGTEDIAEGLQLLLTEPQAPPAPQRDDTAVQVAEVDCEMLSSAQIGSVLSRVAAEADPDANGLSFQDFQSVICHATDFASNFRMSC